ncbi:MAG: hypothetical protein IPJ20_11130 [Flammeovirgaceae bacterium]|nr:hypothetical protein [Flammeovirgaceae bacterium]
MTLILIQVALLGSIMDLHDLVKLPRLIEHYQQHVAKSSCRCLFFGFLNLHYGSEAERHDREDHEEHEDLPFKSPDCTYTHIVSVFSEIRTQQIVVANLIISYSNSYQSASPLSSVNLFGSHQNFNYLAFD